MDIRFFTQEDNKLTDETEGKKNKAKKVPLTGYISGSGKLVIPFKTATQLPLNFGQAAFRVGMPNGKLKAKTLYVVPAESSQPDTFQFDKAAKSYTMLLPVILKKSRIDFSEKKYVFTIETFDYENATGLELQLSQAEKEATEPVATGKKRGPKPKQVE